MKCPHCQKEPFSTMEFLSLAPFKPKACKYCGTEIKPAFLPFMVSILLSPIILIITILVLFQLTHYLIPDTINALIASTIIGVVLSLWISIKLHTKIVPLVEV